MFIQYKFPRTAKVIKDFFGKFDCACPHTRDFSHELGHA